MMTTPLTTCWLLLLTLASIGVQGQVRPELILEGTEAPYHGVVQQEITRRGAKSAFIWNYGKTSSGFFIGPRLLLTAAHNMYSPFGSKVVQYSGYSGRTGAQYGTVSQLAGRQQVALLTYIPESYRWKVFDHDYAIIRFPDDQPAQTTVFELATPGTVHVGDSVFIAGYPAETKSGKDLFLSRGVVSKVGNGSLYYNNETEQGSSGSPVWVKRDGCFLVVAVHVAGYRGKLVDLDLLKRASE